jgi:SAM-dependent methyltransferase
MVDIGCGNGFQMQLIKSQLGTNYFSRSVGVDWSTATIDALAKKSIFDQAILSHSAKLPFADKEFDIVLSMENIEHLYIDDVIPAIIELQRIATYVILVTPLPRDVINMNWLAQEVPNATNDVEPLLYPEYVMLEGTQHKSTLIPESMVKAGFEFRPEFTTMNHGYYYAEADDINIDEIVSVGIDEQLMPCNIDTHDFRSHYVTMLHKSIELINEINLHKSKY